MTKSTLSTKYATVPNSESLKDYWEYNKVSKAEVSVKKDFERHTGDTEANYKSNNRNV